MWKNKAAPNGVSFESSGLPPVPIFPLIILIYISLYCYEIEVKRIELFLDESKSSVLPLHQTSVMRHVPGYLTTNRYSKFNIGRANTPFLTSSF